ncbi:DUF2796 domain-containing protein [Vibrio gallicus]|uniref:DUF2796 domain-containing protein n=1 Tax=Vibrio gallicus TaxID=190897 RepID=UPI0021C3E3D2|nr:DUF2796 domain-containing protein [Vibrio gallicus]
MRKPIHQKTFVFSLLSLCLSTSALGAGFRQHGAHVHGYVTYNIAQDHNQLIIDIFSPGMDIVGFEHDPKTTQEKQAIQRAMELFKDYSSIIDIPSQAQCSIASNNTNIIKSSPNDILSKKENGKIHNPFVDHSTHANFEIEYLFNCDNPEQLNTISTYWFQHFPATKFITANHITDLKQGADELSKNQTKIHIN